jgi:protein-tyrosine-phosphatase
MAEGFAKKHGKGIIDPWSAGSKPSGKVNPTAIQLMKEKDIDLTYHLSKGLERLPQIPKWDYVITMGCGDACPALPAKERRDWALPDPKNLPLDEFRKVRDEIEDRVKALIQEIRTQTRTGPHS